MVSEHTASDLTMVGESTADVGMKLRPVDFSLLSELKEGRNLAANLYMDLDISRQYVNERLTLLEDYGLLDRVGPNPRAGLYEITELGRIAAGSQKEYKSDSVDFDSYLEEELERRQSGSFQQH